MRINKFLSLAGIASRRKSEQLVIDGSVFVNGKKITNLSFNVEPEKDEVRVDGEIVIPKTKKYFLFNKPVGVVSTNEDKFASKKVLDYFQDKDLSIVGRLDKDSEGLIILTNDGDFTQKFSHPKFQHSKEYLVDVKGPTNEFSDHLDSAVKYFKCGIYIDKYKTQPAFSKVISQYQFNKAKFQIILTEGRNRQIRRTMEKAGLRVTNLKRVRIADYELGDLQPGEYRQFTPQQKDIDKL